MMGTVVFGLVYAGLLSAFGSAAWWVGLVIGLAHGALVGLVFMPMMPAVHPRMASRPAGTSAVSGGGVQLSHPGVLGSQWGAMTPVGLLMGHAVYGLVLALVYRLFV